MADFGILPTQIQNIATAELQKNEEIRQCFLAGSSLLSPDFVLITSLRVLVLDEKFMGSLAIPYPNISCNVLFEDIRSVTLDRRLKQRLFGQARIEISAKRYLYGIDNINYQEAKQAHQFITEQIRR